MGLSQTIPFGDLQQIYYGTERPPNAVDGTIFIHTVNLTIEILVNSVWLVIGRGP